MIILTFLEPFRPVTLSATRRSLDTVKNINEQTMRNKSKLVLLSFFSFLATSFTWGGVNGINYALYACDAPVTDLESIEYSQMNPFETGVCGQIYLDEFNAAKTNYP